MGSTPQPQQFCLKWNNHQANMLAVFERLLGSKSLVDVTLGCEGRQIKAHKVVLSACSPFFEGLFTENPCKHPIVILKDIRYADLKALVEFMYKGEVNVVQEQLPTLLKTAEALKIKGLAEVTGETRDESSSSQQANRSASNSTPRPESPNSARRKRQRARRRSTDSAGGGDVISDSEESVPKTSRTDVHDESSMDGASSHDDGSQVSLQRGNKKETATVQTNVDSTSSPASVSASAKSSRSADQTTAASKSAANSNGQIPSSKDTGGGDFEPSRLLEASMTTEQGGDDSTDNLNNTTGPDNSTNNELDIKPLITLDEGGATPAGAIVPASAAAAAALAGADALSSLFPQGAGAAAALAGTSFQNSPPSHGSSGSISSAARGALSPSPSPVPQSSLVTPPPSGALPPLVGTPSALGIPAGNNALQLRPSEACIPCEICGRRFRSLADVRSHVAAIHLKNSEDPERRFQCEFCPFRAYTKTSIRQHMFLHTGEVPYKCDLCSYGARQKFHLDRHRQKAHGMEPTPKRGRFPGRPSSELSILPVGPPSASPPNGSGTSSLPLANGHSSDPELITPFPPVFPPMLDPAALKLASNLFQLISSTNGGSGSSGAGGNGSSASTGSDHSSQDNDV